MNRVKYGLLTAVLASASIVTSDWFLRACLTFSAVLLGLLTILFVIRTELRGE